MMPHRERSYLAAMLTSLPLDFESGIRELRALGFTHVDLVAIAERPQSHLEALAESGLLVSCGAIGRGFPEGYTLDAASVTLRSDAVQQMKQQITDIARLGGTYAYVVPGSDDSAQGLACFAEACILLADFASRRMVRLCIEHCPGKALSSAAATLDLLKRIGHPNLGLLLDVGHCLLSNEDPAAVIARGKDRIFYIHLDDNDGVSDLHWPLLTGRLTEDSLRQTLAALQRQGYAGGLSLELRAENVGPGEALRLGRELLHRLMQNG